MSLELDFNTEPMEPGEKRALILRSKLPAEVKIRCFVRSPPPGYRPCDECGTFKVGVDESIMIHAGPKVFGESGGRLEIEVTDSAGQRKSIRLKVLGLDEAGTGDLVKEEVKV